MGGQELVVDQRALCTLIDMGYDRNIAIEALIKSNNNVELAKQMLGNNFTHNWPGGPPPSASGGKITQEYLSSVLAQHHVPFTSPTGSKNSPIDLQDEDSQIKYAMQLSLQNTQPGLAGYNAATKMDVDSVSQEDIELNKAIEKSITEQKGDVVAMGAVTDNPQWRKREGEIAVGLKNIGNTCYFNSMLQTYFMLPDIRKSVLSFPSSITLADGDPNKPTVEFMKRLQKLFVFLLHSNQKYVDPSDLLRHLIGKDGKPVSIGDQQDVADFNELFIKTIEKGLEMAEAENKTFTNLIKKYFFGNGPEYLSVEQNGVVTESFQDSEFSSLILPISENPSHLFDRLDACVCQEVEGYKIEKEGGSAKAQRCLWLKNLPIMLMIQQSRVQYDVDKKNYVKRESPVKFEKEIFIDRYLIENREETTKRRAIVTQWKNHLETLEKELKSYTNYKGRSHGLDEALMSIIDYCNDRQEIEKDPIYSTILEKLKHRMTIESDVIASLRNRVEEYQLKIDGAYSDMRRKPYSLFAVWVHQGYAGSGHYWAFIRDPQTDKWIKFNDLRVSETDEETVFKEAIGGQANTSAYFLIYMDKEAFQSTGLEGERPINWNDYIPAQLMKEVQEDNNKFTKELEEYMKKNTDKFQQFCDKYSNILQETDTLSRNQAVDTKIKNYYSFLDTLGLHQMMLAEVVIDTYKDIFGREIVKDMGSGIYDKINERIGAEIMAEVNKLVFESSLSKPYREQYQIYQKVTQYYEAGLVALIEKKYLDAIRSLTSAWQLDKEVDNKVSRSIDIMEAITVCLLLMLTEANKKLHETEKTIGLTLLRQLVATSCNVFSPEHPNFILLKERYTNFSQAAQVSLSIRDTLNDLKGLLDGVRKPLLPFTVPTLETLDTVKSEQLGQQHIETLKKFHVEFAEILNVVKIDKMEEEIQ